MKNLLPNASFEIDFGQAKHDWVKYNPGEGAADNWTDMFTPLTAPLAKNDQVPQTWPTIEAAADAPDGVRAAVITAAPGKPGHLTSPVVAVKGGHGYTLSVYARGDDAAAGARLHMCVWHQPLNWDVPPDAQSDPIAVTNQWQRYEMTFVVPTWLHTAVVDLMAVADGDAKLWVDAVQFEHAPQATTFETRLATEAHITADTYFSGMLHLHGKPLELKLNVYQHRPADDNGDLKVRIETLEGRDMLATQVAAPASPGRHTVPLSLDFPWVGDFRAKVFSAAGERIDVATYGYMFTVHPVMQAGFGWEEPAPAGDDFQGILYSRDGEVHELPAERYRLPICQIGEGTWTFTITNDHRIYMPAAVENPGVHSNLLCTRDGGRTWDAQQVTRPIAAVLRDGSFLSFVAPEPPHWPPPRHRPCPAAHARRAAVPVSLGRRRANVAAAGRARPAVRRYEPRPDHRAARRDAHLADRLPQTRHPPRHVHLSVSRRRHDVVGPVARLPDGRTYGDRAGVRPAAGDRAKQPDPAARPRAGLLRG